MDRYAVIGNPVAHSRSPFIHTAFARATGQALAYERLRCDAGDFGATVRRFAAEGGRGCNVTVPFKFEAPRLAAQVTGRAALAGAANVLRFDAGSWLADNTDGAGLVRDIERNEATPLAGARVLLVGAGGAAAGALGPLLRARPAEVVLANRTPAKARSLADRHAALAAQQGVDLRACGLADCGTGFDIVVNASASSLAQGGVPVAARVLAPGALAIDMMYGPLAQPFVDWARSHGARGRDGLGMLVEQAAEAFLLWRGVEPATAPVLAALRERWDSTL
jgi:shikimate dehydrogenase